jgi:hypothetical protein
MNSYKFTQNYPTERKDYYSNQLQELERENAGEKNEELHPYDTSENTPNTPDFKLHQVSRQTPTAAVNLEKDIPVGSEQHKKAA